MAHTSGFQKSGVPHYGNTMMSSSKSTIRNKIIHMVLTWASYLESEEQNIRHRNIRHVPVSIIIWYIKYSSRKYNCNSVKSWWWVWAHIPTNHWALFKYTWQEERPHRHKNLYLVAAWNKKTQREAVRKVFGGMQGSIIIYLYVMLTHLPSSPMYEEGQHRFR